MPEIGQLLKERSRETGIRQDILEKDYALSYLLAAIAATPGLGGQVVLKGGTALRKLYYPDYRFSEDLDYSTLPIGKVPDLPEKFNQAVGRMAGMLDERGPFRVQVEPLVLREAHPSEQAAYTVRVQFPSHRQALCRLKVEISVDEPVLTEPQVLPVWHAYEEPISASVPTYSLAEIVSEKLRALLQSRARLSERGWGASRVCRDYYDLWHILRAEGRLGGQIPDLVERKCRVRGVSFPSPGELVSPELFQVARQEWLAQLQPFVPDAPEVETVLAEIHPLILNLWE